MLFLWIWFCKKMIIEIQITKCMVHTVWIIPGFEITIWIFVHYFRARSHDFFSNYGFILARFCTICKLDMHENRARNTIGFWTLVHTEWKYDRLLPQFGIHLFILFRVELLNPYRQIPETISKKRAVTQGIFR